jgi:uncharacterized RDD family membrane protein YckC
MLHKANAPVAGRIGRRVALRGRKTGHAMELDDGWHSGGRAGSAAVTPPSMSMPAIIAPVGIAASAMHYAGPIRRAIGGVIDLVVIAVAVLIVVTVLRYVRADGSANLTHIAARLGGAFVVFYFIGMEARLGATLGKLLVGVRVVNERDGSPIRWHTAVVRNLMRMIDAIGFFLVGFIAICVTEKHQRLGDKVAGTVVIRCPA